MPHSKRLKSLSKLCLDYVKQNMSEIGRIALLREPNGVDAPNSTSPFDYLSTNVLETVVKHLEQNNLLQEPFLKLLITPCLRTLNFSMCNDSAIVPLLLFASKKCTKLTSLWVGKHGYILDCQNLLALPTFTYLEILDVSKSGSPNSLMMLLGKHCKLLRELYVNESEVTDAGIKDLCVTGQCKSIQILSIFNGFDPDLADGGQRVSRVTREGILMALNTLPVLRDLCHISVLQTLASLHQTMREESPSDTMPKYSLSALNVRNTSPFSGGDLKSALAMCTSLTKVKIIAPHNFHDSDLFDLSPADQLKDLSISGGARCPTRISFGGGVAPLLRDCSVGSKLESLFLVNIAEVNIRLIVKNCRNLRSLNLNMKRGKTYRGEQETNLEPLKKLEVLNMVDCASSNDIVLLLSSPSLVTVVLRECSGLKNRELARVAEFGSFQKWQRFELISNLMVTKEGIDNLMTESNALKLIKLEGVERVTSDDVNVLRQQIFEENWDLVIESIELREFYWNVIDDYDVFFPVSVPANPEDARRN